MVVVSGGSLLISDFTISLSWVCSNFLIKYFVYKTLGFFEHDITGETLKHIFALINMFFFAYLRKISKGGSYNPLTVLSDAISGDFTRFLFTLGARIPVQVLGSIVGVRLILAAFTAIGNGPTLNVEIHHGALTEGLLTFMIVFISLVLSSNVDRSFTTKTWIHSLSKLILHILGSDLTGGCMNPASVMGWAYARGEHLKKEHVIVYWLAPVQATLLAVWIFRLVFQANTKCDGKEVKKSRLG